MDSPKYNRTPHLPFSPGKGDDDKVANSVETLIGKPLIITEKLDGSNTSLERGGCFARTHACAPKHESFDALKALHASLFYHIPKHIQLFGEWCYAKHSIEYTELPGYFMLFGVRDLETYYWGAWEEVEMWAEKLHLPTVPVLFSGTVHSEKGLYEIVNSLAVGPSKCGGEKEGVVVRLHAPFSDDKFSESIMKWVRKGHVHPSMDHWLHKEIVRNKLK